jgi:HPt (histidine-containing phosphotransfer) domain-containing protein
MMTENVTLPAIDLVRIREAADGDEEFLRQLIEVFLDDTALRMQELNAALEARDGRVLGRTAHQLKGSSANVGASMLFDLARTLEKMGQGNELARAQEVFAGLEAEYARVRTELEQMLAA